MQELRQGVTARITSELCARRIDAYPAKIRQLAAQCFLDWAGVTLAGAREAAPMAVLAEMELAGGREEALILGQGCRLPAPSAALVNGTAAHALDYDDVSFHMSAHPSVVLFPALLALAERRGASGAQILESYVAGYEAGCRIGRLFAPDHYGRGFHGTATIGTFAAAAAAAHLLRLDEMTTRHALGIAATQAAGIRAMFGTDCKPFHAGAAARNGLLAAALAARGMQADPAALEARVGFGETHSADFDIGAAFAEAPGGYYLSDNLFKYHASCYLTHSSIEALGQILAQNAIEGGDIASVDLQVDPELETVCNIASPQSGLELKFSLRGVAALVLCDVPTGRIGSFSADRAMGRDIRAAQEKVQVAFAPQVDKTVAAARVTLSDGRVFDAVADSGRPDSDLDRQEARLVAKFCDLTEARFGEERARISAQGLLNLETAGIADLRAALGGDATEQMRAGAM